MQVANHLDIDRMAVEKGGLYAFLRIAWSAVEGGVPFVGGKHMQLVCEHLEAVTRGELKELVISQPPGTGKSSIISVFWPAWEWLVQAHIRWMFTSFDPSLSQRDALKSKELIKSAWYQARWGAGTKSNVVLTSQDDESARRQDGAGVFWNTQGGLRFSTSMLGKATGWHVHRQVADDPIKPSQIQEGGSKAIAALEKCLTTWDGTFSTRKVDPKNFSRVVMMQRLHERDLAGVCIERGYTALVLPMEFEPARKCITPWGHDWRTEPGELLWPERYDHAAVESAKVGLGSALQISAQLQQDPIPEGGAIYKSEWFSQRFTDIPKGARWLLSLDATFKKTERSDYCVFQIWAMKAAKMYLIEQYRDKMDFPETLAKAEQIMKIYPEIKEILIEDKANGSGIIQTLKGRFAGVIGYSPDVSKEARANAATIFWESGSIYLPQKDFVPAFVQEHIRFPRAAHDDQVDCANQAILRLTNRLKRRRNANRLEKAMKNVNK